MDRIRLKAVGDMNLRNVEDPFGKIGHLLKGTDILVGYTTEYLTDDQERLLTGTGFNMLMLRNQRNISRKISIVFYPDLSKNRSIGFLGGYWWNSSGEDDRIENGYEIVHLESEVVLNDIRKKKRQSDHVVCCLNWGYPGEHLPFPGQRELAQEMIEEGCNLVLGSGPGVVQGIEEYEDGLIVYSLGNFVGKNLSTSESKKSFILECELWGNQVAWDIIPVSIDSEGRPELVSDKDSYYEFKQYVKDDLGYGFSIANYNFYWGRERRNKELGDHKF